MIQSFSVIASAEHHRKASGMNRDPRPYPPTNTFRVSRLLFPSYVDDAVGDVRGHNLHRWCQRLMSFGHRFLPGSSELRRLPRKSPLRECSHNCEFLPPRFFSRIAGEPLVSGLLTISDAA